MRPLLLAQVVVEVAAEQQHHGDDVLGHAGTGGALQVGEQDVPLVQQRLLHAALDTGSRPLDPLEVLGLLEHLLGAHTDADVRVGDVAGARRRHLHELRLRHGRLQQRQVVVYVGGDQDDARRAPAGTLTHRRLVHRHAERVGKVCAGRGLGGARGQAAGQRQGEGDHGRDTGAGQATLHRGPRDRSNWLAAGAAGAVYAMPPLTEITWEVT